MVSFLGPPWGREAGHEGRNFGEKLAGEEAEAPDALRQAVGILVIDALQFSEQWRLAALVSSLTANWCGVEAGVPAAKHP